jgi:ADP-heptose:LPS heptosyltransferase
VALTATRRANLLWVDDAPARSVVVLRALPGLGDLLCAVPALRALRASLPDAHVAVIGLPSQVGALLLERYGGYVDELIEFPGYPGLPERSCDLRRLAGFLEDMRFRRFDLALQLHGSGEVTNELVSLLGARATGGFQRTCVTPLDRERCLTFSEHEPEPARNLSLLRHLGADGSPELEFPIRPPDRARLDLATSPLLDGPYAVIHPGAARADRRWGVARFAEVGDALVRRGLPVVLTGSEAERELTIDVARRMRRAVIDLTGGTDVGALAALLGSAAVVVCNDTGVSHLAAAVHAPSVVVFTTSNRARWAPLDGNRHRAVRPGESCEPVLRAVDELLVDV